MTRTHVVLLDRSGYDLYRHPDGRPFLDPADYDVTLVTLPAKSGQVRPGEVGAVHAINVLDEAEVLSLAPVLSARPVDHVVAVGERLLVPAARLREAIGVPGFSSAQMTLLRDKCAMKRHIGAAGVRVPAFHEIMRPLDALDLLTEYGEVILKPRASMGSVGVHRVRTVRELHALERTGLSVDDAYEAEEYIAGDMFHVDSIVRDGVPLVAEPSLYLDSNEHFELGGQNASVTLDPGRLRDIVLDFNRAVLATLPWFSGVTHHEVFLDRLGLPVLCEIAGRAGGGGIVPAFRHRFGVDLNLLTALPQLGRELPDLAELQPPSRRRTGTAVFYPPSVGVLAAEVPVVAAGWLVQFTRLRHAGDLLPAPVSVGQGVVEITVCGPDSTAVRRRIAAVRRRLQITVTSDSAALAV